MLGSIGLPEILIILFILIVLFGINKLPKLGKNLGLGIREFGGAIKEFRGAVEDEEDKEEKKDDKTHT